ncbi:Ribonuclease T2 precursor (RNase T2) [Friedmanniomyces endolithicus]|uniref:Ribonuclease T2-like n=1 Tax=Friedmanniomyces endolithicus TaxID=329885 RepID=A0AAN6FTQ3_9PEZI|nr:Ribonuclease T2 precursor (RNase T2) [Friedmanniomyces endolithicus]KAK0293827.1 Ribonuclease T2 precursor (RNase T2) [Friedmanniomyces endolithicus]KAK0324341.1 Ribonuclease T2 precursor (RNase T2) [Friedmanniomyces endolithicus]KAK0991690.1 Ribonuclease T2 precursor (RNase T2) [Friedmanniomyces endolithicus]
MAQLDEVHNVLASHFSTGWSDITNHMPSIRTLFAFGLSALTNVQSVFGLHNAVTRQFSQDLSASATCTSPQLSCHNTSAVADLCCFNSPGGELLQTQFWDTAPVTGPSDSWTIHGLWPDNCDGTYDSSCDPSRAYTNITHILQAAGASDLVSYMQTYWVSNSGTPESFWEHEWSKHGTCISTLDPNCYTSYQPTEEVPDFFNQTVNLFKSLPSYEWLSEAGIVPSTSATYTTAQIQAALSKNRGGHQVYLGCQSSALNEIWYFFNVQGSIQTGTFEASDLVGSKSTCPSTGIKYLPKGNGGGSSPTSAAPLPGTSTTTSSKPSTTASSKPSTTASPKPSTTTSAAPSPTSGGPGFSGKGTLNVITSGSQTGCIISGGTWYTSGTCAGFTATTLDDGFTLSSRKGDCAIVGGALTCGSSVSSATSFSADGDLLVYDGAANFSADGVPSGNTQGTVYTGEDHSTSLTIQWQGF